MSPNADVRKLLVSQALRAFTYGFASILLGSSLEKRGWSTAQVGALLTAVVAGTALTSFLVGTFGDRIGRRRFYALLYVGLTATGLVYGTTSAFWALAGVALLGTLSTEVNDSGPFTSLEQAMLPSQLTTTKERTRVFGIYNVVAVTVGSVGALAAGGPELLRRAWSGAPDDHRFFLVLVPVGVAGALIAWSLSDGVESTHRLGGARVPLQRSKGNVTRLAALFALDSFGGGFIVQSFIAYWFTAKFGVSLEALGLIFFFVGLLQAASFLVATRLAGRIGLLNVMIFTHLPSNLFLAAIPLAPTLPVAAALLFGRFCLSQMDVPTRQAYVVSLVDPAERTAAAAYTNTARYIVRPLGPLLAGASQQVAFGAPFFLAGALKVVYDVALWGWFRKVPLAADEVPADA